MAMTNAELLERNISTSINGEFSEVAPTEVQFVLKASEIRQIFHSMYPVTDEEFENIKRRLRANIVVKMDLGFAIKDRNNPHKSWLPSRRAEIDFFFWNRYKKYLEMEKNWNPRVIHSLDRVSDEIVDLLGNPNDAEPFQRRGLVLGDVQSGKTANYTAICNKVSDAGYRVIIILAGMTNILRQQTQERLDAEFIGKKSDYFLDPKATIQNVPVGVHSYGRQDLHDKEIGSLTSVTKDFNKDTLRTLNLSIYSFNTTTVFVLKKNTSPLLNIIHWLKKSNRGTGTIDLPMLLIDDEADNASVNTNDEERDPTAINSSIRKLLSLFSQASYLGITATPYANIFISPDSSSEMLGDDLFPRDFIYLLSPPDDYIGAKNIFGDDDNIPAKYASAIEPIFSKEMDAFFPFNHKKELIVSELPPSMKKALAYFLLINGIRDVRGEGKRHRSMMIHVSRFTIVQNQLRDRVNEWLLQVRSDLQNYASLPERKSDEIESIAFIRSVWDEYDLGKKIPAEEGSMPWHLFLSTYLFKAIAPINVRAVNQNSGSTSLDYFNHRDDGLRVIAIGGNSLSRGLTLEGLCVSYFYRKSKMYDTLLQMGRWFGYRPGYEDLFKIWMSSEAIDWYGYITSASEELKREIGKMKLANLTPMQFGLKVRQDPASLIVTARDKMRSAREIKRPINISGRLLETPRLKADTITLKSNEEVFKDFVQRLPTIGKRTMRNDTDFFWEGVDKYDIEQLIRDFRTHPWHLAYQGQALADYVIMSDKFGDWDVVIARGQGTVVNLRCGNEVLHISSEKRYIKATEKQISISGTKVRVGAGGATKIGLSEKQREEAERKFKSDPNNKDKNNIPDSAYLNIDRKPILMLHIIEVDKNGDNTEIDEGCIVPDFLYAIGIGIPDTGEEEIAHYMINTVELSNYIDLEDEEDL